MQTDTMATKQYNVTTVARPQTRGKGATGGDGQTSVTNITGTGVSSGDGHTHSNKTLLDALVSDADFYLYIRDKLAEADESTLNKIKAGLADEATHAAEADHATNSDKWDEHQFGDYLNQGVRTTDIVTFLKVIAAVAASPDFVQGIETGSGWRIDSGGNGEMSSLTLRSFLKVPQLIYNKIRVTGGEMWNTEGGTIAEVIPDEDSDTAFTLKMDVEDGDTIDLDVDDICKGHYNSSGGFVTSYFRVTAVNQAAKTIRIVLGADSEVPGGANNPPVPYMNIARYGNFTDEERQRSQYFSSSEQRISLLSGVDQYIITPQHHKVVIGNIPDALVPTNLPIQGQPSIYLDNVLARNFFQLDSSGTVVKTIRDRGLWSSATASSSSPYKSTSDMQDEVYHNSCKYRCLVDGTTQEPRYDSTDWLLVAGDTTLEMTVDSSEGATFLAGQLDTVLTATVRRGVTDITTEILASDWSWTRETGNAVADAIWNTDHASCGRSVHITNEDLTTPSGKFVCTAYVRDGNVTLEQEVDF